MQSRGFDVHVITGPATQADLISQHGIQHHEIGLSRNGYDLRELFYSIASLVKLFKLIKPNIIHLITVKPMILGGIAARITKVPSVVFSVSGLGPVFSGTNIRSFFRKKIVTFLYNFVFQQKNTGIIFQNTHDMAYLINRAITNDPKLNLIPGSGVDLNRFKPTSEPEGIPRVVLISRMLKEKGIFEFVRAASELKNQGVAADFVLVGGIDNSPGSLEKSTLMRWHQEGTIYWKGFSKDIPGELAQCNIVILPSYREGLPKALIEAAACARAVITTDTPGCRDAIIPGETGLLVPPQDSAALATAIQQLLDQPDRRKTMGEAGRRLAEEKFSLDKVIERHVDLYSNLLECQITR